MSPHGTSWLARILPNLDNAIHRKSAIDRFPAFVREGVLESSITFSDGSSSRPDTSPKTPLLFVYGIGKLFAFWKNRALEKNDRTSAPTPKAFYGMPQASPAVNADAVGSRRHIYVTCTLESSSLALLRRNRATKARSRGRPSPLTFDTANTGVMRSEAMLSAAASTCCVTSSKSTPTRPRLRLNFFLYSNEGFVLHN